MISGAHVMIFTRDEAADRAFLRDVLEIPCIDSGGGWQGSEPATGNGRDGADFGAGPGARRERC